jgi:hypothetical protein
MHLFKLSQEILVWLRAVLGVFLRTHPVLMPALVAVRVIAHVTQLLAFFIPLKVLLLVATPGVPLYFQTFIEPQHRTGWIVALSTGAVATYLLTVVLDKLSEHWSEIGSRDLLRKSSQLAVIGNQREAAKRYYSSFSGLAANLVLVVSMFSVGLWLYPALFAFLAGFMVLQVVASWAALRSVDPIEPKWFGGYIVRSAKSYFGYLETLNFLAVFLFLIVDFLVFDGVNLLIAILSFLMARRLLSSARALAAEAVTLNGQRYRIDPLVFLEERHVPKQSGHQLELGRYFPVDGRQQRLKQALALAGIPGVAAVRSRWVDSGSRQPAIHQFDVEACSESGDTVFVGVEQVVPQSQQQVMENEALIVEHLGRHALCMAETIHEYRLGTLRCRLLDLRGTRPISMRRWRSGRCADLLLHLWAVDPGDGLRRIFQLSRPYLHERLTLEALDRLEVAVDTPAKQASYRTLRQRLAEIQSVISALPVFPLNHALSYRIVYLGSKQPFVITEWGHWSLEPVGCGLAPDLMDEAMILRLGEALEQRGWAGAMPELWQLQLAASAYQFEEQLLTRGRFNAALELAGEILKCLERRNKGESGSDSGGEKKVSNA